MKITVHLFSADDRNGTHAAAYAVEREAEDDMLQSIGHDREAFEAWLADNPDGDIWQFKDEEGEHDHSLDTFNIDTQRVDFDLCAQPLPETGYQQVAEAMECLRRARDLLKAADNPRTLARIRAALSSAKGAARIQWGREGRARREQLQADASAFEREGDTAQAADVRQHITTEG